MTVNYKHLYQQTKLMLEKYQDEIVPELRRLLDEREEVVRCEDCEYYENEECVCPYIYMSDAAHLYPDLDDFCSHGKRRG